MKKCCQKPTNSKETLKLNVVAYVYISCSPQALALFGFGEDPVVAYTAQTTAVIAQVGLCK